MLYISACKSYISYKICKCFLPLCVLTFHFLHGVYPLKHKTTSLGWLRTINVIPTNLFFSFLTWVLWLFGERIMINTLGANVYRRRPSMLSTEHRCPAHGSKPLATLLALITHQSLWAAVDSWHLYGIRKQRGGKGPNP